MTPRSLAKQQGLKTYETGIPCKKGHIAPRATATGTCIVCTQEAAAAWRKKNPNKSSEYTAAYRAKNIEKVRELDREAHAKARAADREKFRAYSAKRYREKVEAEESRPVRTLNLTPIADLVVRLNKVFSGNIQYISGFVGMQSKASFLCTIHENIVSAIPHNVLRGANPCPKCGHMKSSAEERIADLLSVYAPVIKRDRSFIGPKELDVFMPSVGLAIEYCGMYWHSHGSSDEEKADKYKHYLKYEACKNKGVRLLTIYESEWQEHEYAVRRLLRNAANKSKGRLMARKCILQKVTNAQAKTFFEKYHPQGGNGSGEHYALLHNGKIVACMRFAYGVNDRGHSTRTWTLARFATRITVAGAASRLFKAFLQEYKPQEVKSFSDNRYFDGKMYEKLGFQMVAEVPPDYQVWSQKLGLLPKSHYQRRNIQKRLVDHGMDITFNHETDERSEAEMTYLMGARRIYDCGKKRWIWTPVDPTPAS